MTARISLSVILGVVSCANAQSETLAVDYLSDVKPILASKCFACHGALRQQASLRLDAASLISVGGDSGPAVVPGDATESVLLQRVSDEDPDFRMPPEGEGERLTEQQVAMLRAWILAGAPTPADEPVPADPREHWAYQPITRTELPSARKPDRNQIDDLLDVVHLENGLQPAPAAERATWLRRVYFNLIGLPPTRVELREYLADDSAAANLRVVDDLLARPEYGQHWGRHWMDVWRYSDWAGFGEQVRYSQKHIWRWRDWIVESLNSDKGYDQMIVEMLAGDELAPFRRDAVVATGFLARNWYKFDRDSWLNDAIDHTARAFLAVTMRCARCHDHKYDPISQEEYYRLRAIFEPHDVRIDLAPGEEDADKHGMARVCDARPDEPTYLFVRGNPNQPDESQRIEPGLPHILGGNYQTSPVKLSSDNYYPALRDLAVQDKFAELRRKVSAAYRAAESLRSNDEPDQAELTTAEKELDAALAELASYEARLAAERNRIGLTSSPAGESSLEDLTVAATAAQRRANLSRAEADVQAAKLQLERAKAAESDDDEASRQAVQSANKEFQAAEERLKAVVKGETDGESSLPYDPLGPNCPPVSTGRRLALARWIVQPENPLTARVAVNHIWMRHFGSPLVDHVDDFGLRSPRPPLMDLLDYLASELIESGWSMKHVHRLIATSAVYRRRSSVGSDSSAPADTYAATRAADPDNHFYWRMNIRRADAESVRDALLLASGRLDASLGGPDIDHHREAEIARRSLYFRHAREKQMKFLMIFDAANPSECYRREESIRPQQAFALINSRLVSDESKRLADRLINELTNGAGASQADRSTPLNGRFIVAAFETILSRRPIPAEMEACQEFLAGQTELLQASEDLELLGSEQVEGVALPSSDPAHRARQNLVLVLFNQNDFVTIR